MKKIILPMVAVALMTACSDVNEVANFANVQNQPGAISSSSDAIVPAGESSSSDAVVPPTGLSSSSDAILPGVSSSSNGALPVDLSSSSVASSAASQFTYAVPTLTELDPTKTYSFYGAELSGKVQFKYGRFEARMKMAAISGSVSSMFLYYDDSWEKGEKPWNEIDIEVLGKAPDKWQSNIITREGDPSIKANTSSESKPLHEYGFDATQDFHLYAIVWTPEYVAWEIDSVEIRRDPIGLSRGSHADADQVAFLTEDQTLRFNLWASKSTAWTGAWNKGIGLPVEQQIDYVRVYSYDAATKGFTMLWQDDFNGEDIDYERWGRGDWEMERVNLRPDNVIVEKGVCRLILDYEAN
ncbi:glycoside hydrolase family 16 protein [Fibrobacter sp. UWB12]|uniref:glycoside hydrolase family 16 protein n=1 Tax=Fibrobacter sp. UWB12 TaxID=1896203 RepID=UPI0009130C5A|nr:glycoside hydrolase family 16 protein [Fibrobacter sp. UWB12]SHK77161.1 Glycosyl hydrolases family 16 [Fibrobacter sp. UWB12]